MSMVMEMTDTSKQPRKKLLLPDDVSTRLDEISEKSGQSVLDVIRGFLVDKDNLENIARTFPAIQDRSEDTVRVLVSLDRKLDRHGVALDAGFSKIYEKQFALVRSERLGSSESAVKNPKIDGYFLCSCFFSIFVIAFFCITRALGWWVPLG